VTKLVDHPCPDCGYDGPHYLFAPNEAECGACYLEFTLADPEEAL